MALVMHHDVGALLGTTDSDISPLMHHHYDHCDDSQDDSETALVWASAKGNLEMVEALLAAGANVNATSNEVGAGGVINQGRGRGSSEYRFIMSKYESVKKNIK